MAKKLPQYQQDALLVLRTRLNYRDPNNQTSEEIKAHLRAIDHWLTSWVLPAVDCIDSEREPGTQWLRDAVGQDAYRMRKRLPVHVPGTAAAPCGDLDTANGNPHD